MTNSTIRWGRVVIAALLSEVGVMAVIIIMNAAYRFLVAPGRSSAEYQAFGDAANYYVAPIAAGLATFFGALWATRKMTSSFIVNGTLVGLIAVVLTVGLLFAAKPEDRLMYGVSYLLRVLGGYFGGLVARQMSTRRSPSPLPAL